MTTTTMKCVQCGSTVTRWPRLQDQSPPMDWYFEGRPLNSDEAICPRCINEIEFRQELTASSRRMTNTMDLPNRDQQHGGIQAVGSLAQTIKHAIRQQGRNYHRITFAEREALDMIAHKIARLLSGDCSDPEHWIDIAGYAHTIVRLQNGADQSAPAEPSVERKAERSAGEP